MTANLHDAPYYVMLSQSNLVSPSTTSLVHPIIQYHFADDNPHDILPTHEGESVIILDYEPGKVTPLVESASRNIAVTGIKVTDAPPSGTPTDGEPRRNDNMFILETISGQGDDEQGATANSSNLSDPRHILAQFRERNEILKQVVDRQSLRSPKVDVRNDETNGI